MNTYLPLGDSAFIVKFGEAISEETNAIISSYSKQLIKLDVKGIIELIPSYNEILVVYNPMEIDYKILVQLLKDLENTISINDSMERELIRIPVCYDEKFALDLDFVSEHTELSIKEIIRSHSEPNYLVYMLGFTPGFPYLGGMNKQLSSPRKVNPRTKVEVGSVGIADSQTGIYPIESPGGWQIIGKTPLKLYAPLSRENFLLKSGNFIKFYPIDIAEFEEIEWRVKQDKYTVKRELIPYNG